MNKKYFVSCSISLLFIFISSSDDAFAQQKKTENNIITDSCTCTQTPARLAGRYTPPLNIFTSYDKFFEATHTKFLVTEQDYKSYGFRDMQTDVGHHGGESYYSLTIASKIPIRLTNPGRTFTLNLTPCKIENTVFDLPISMSYNFPIRTYIPDFDPKTFDHYAASYFDIYSHMTGLGPEVIFKELLEEHFTNDEDERYTMLNEYIVSLNKRFKATFKTIPPYGAGYQKYFDDIMAGLRSRKVDFRELVIKDFIFMEDIPSEHIITEGEAHQLEYIFRDHWRGTIETIDNYIIRPQFRGSTHGEKIGIEIDKNILRSWNSSQSKPGVDSTGKDKIAAILANMKSIQFSNEDGIESEIASVCMYPSEITGTGMLIHFRNAQLITSQEQRSRSIKETNYPLFIKDSVMIAAGREKYYEYRLDSVLDHFSGLMVHDASLSIPFKKKVIEAKVTNMLINDRLISGRIEIPLTPKEKGKPGDIYIGPGKLSLKTNMQELETFLHATGLVYSEIQRTEGALVLYFKRVM